MRVTVVERREEITKPRYPYFGIDENGLVVFFINERQAYCVRPSSNGITEFGDPWRKGLGEFKPFYGIIVVEE